MARNPRKSPGKTKARKKAAKPRTRAAAARRVLVMVATRKGAWLFHGDAARKTWRADGPHFLGHIVNHIVLDPRDGRTLLAAAKTGHLGPTVFRSTDFGRTWKEAAQPPAFAKAANGDKGRAVDHTFWLTPGHASEPDVWYAGTSPQGLFRSEDGGVTWEPFSSINDDPQYREWMGTVQDGTPDGPKLHSIIVDPRDPAHLYFAHVGRRRARVARRRQHLDAADQGPRGGRGLRPDRPSRSTTRTACGSARAIRTGSTSRTTAASTASTGRRRSGSASAKPCRSRSATSAFRWSCIRATPTPPGSSRWTAPTVWPRTSPDGKPGGLRHAQRRQDLERLDAGLPEEPGLVDREAPGDDARTRRIPSASTSAPPAASSG